MDPFLPASRPLGRYFLEQMDMPINAKQFDEIARTVFSPIYPVIARQIVEYTGITQGSCLDAGCGSGHLGTALAGITNLHMIFFDAAHEMLTLAENTIEENGLRSRTGTLPGDIDSIALPTGSVDLVISRGSIFFGTICPEPFVKYIASWLQVAGLGSAAASVQSR